MKFINEYSAQIDKLKEALEGAEAVLIGAGAGLSAAAGYSYSGKRFREHFGDFQEKYGFTDMYSGGFFPFPSLEEFWAYWSRYVLINRYTPPPEPVYEALLSLVGSKDYFVITTNVDHCFQRAGFDKARLFYTQGDYGLFQCSAPCCDKTYDNEGEIRRMAAEQRDMKIPKGLVPRCPVCGRPMAMNLRTDETFVQDKGWRAACERYRNFAEAHKKKRMLYLELGVGNNTPGIIKYPFRRLTAQNKDAVYCCINLGEPFRPKEIERQSIYIEGDIGEALAALAEAR